MINIIRKYVSKFSWFLILVSLTFSTVLPARAQTNNLNQIEKPNVDQKVFIPFVTSGPAAVAGVYYLSPTGNDTKSGKTIAEAWKTFDRALNSSTSGTKLKPGETLVLLDGVYNQSIAPYMVGGQAGKPITVMALNDGKAIIDGQGVRIPVYLEDWKNATYYVIKGIVARNGSGAVFQTTANNNTFQRVSGYNANTNSNQHVFIIWANNTLLEDCIASGSGRKMIVVFSSVNTNGQHNTVRRCFANYREWDGKNWHDEWPWNENFESYSGDYNTFENDIAYGFFANAGFSLLSNGTTDDNIGNQILGSIAINGGRDFEGNVVNWGNIRPQPTQYGLMKDILNPSHRVGFFIGHDGTIKDNLLQDILAWGGAGLGIRVDNAQPMTNDRVNRATFVNNGLDLSYGSRGIDALNDDLAKLTISNSQIKTIKSLNYPYSQSPSISGEGARLQYRYINGVLKDGSDGTSAQPLWPWPMEDRIRSEMGISVTNLISSVTHQAQIANPVAPMSDTTNIYPDAYLSATPTNYPFGNAKIGIATNKPITIKNLGTANLTVTEFQFDSQGSTRFSIGSGGTCSQLPITLTPGQSCTVNVAFTPQDYQAQTSYLTIISPEVGPYPKPARVYLTGLGYSSVTANNLPAKLQAEAYTTSGGIFQVKPTLDDGGSGKIAGADSGAWISIPINVTQTGNYTVSARTASINNGGNSVRFSLEIDGVNVATFYPTNTGNWDTFADNAVTNIPLSSGNHTLKVNYLTGGFDLNFFNILLQ